MNQLSSYMTGKISSFLQKKKSKRNRYKQSALLEGSDISTFPWFFPVLLSSSMGLFFQPYQHLIDT